jgi:hypothetical protein
MMMITIFLLRFAACCFDHCRLSRKNDRGQEFMYALLMAKRSLTLSQSFLLFFLAERGVALVTTNENRLKFK